MLLCPTSSPQIMTMLGFFVSSAYADSETANRDRTVSVAVQMTVQMFEPAWCFMVPP